MEDLEELSKLEEIVDVQVYPEDIKYDLISVGTAGQLELNLNIPTRGNSLAFSTVPFPLPSCFQNYEEELYSKFFDLPDNFVDLVNPAKSSEPVHWGRPEPSVPSLHLVYTSPPLTSIELIPYDQAKNTGTHYRELSRKDYASGNATNSTSLLREPGNIDDFAKGSSSNFPFMPGGMNQKKDSKKQDQSSQSDTVFTSTGEIDPAKLLTVPPGWNSGISFNKNNSIITTLESDTKPTDVKGKENEVQTFRAPPRVNIQDLYSANLYDLSDDEEDEALEPLVDDTKPVEYPALSVPFDITNPSEGDKGTLKRADSFEDLLKLTGNRQNLRRNTRGNKKFEWATTEHVDVSNFDELVPDPVIKYPFDLDVFQKEAVYHLERGESVFVAAHTSAGKTVVAEYAIAMAAKHMTRAIYTSPIKALSNQKFRDFKETFGDVGLITGDVSIKPEASCLILTTEILRSMLYRGADMIRDVEWVIFDEVHYVNDIERGVVWEEVIIMLPAHVNLILLSATVPNTVEFADWIGRTKKKKIWVISTLKRPVPLEHYIYCNEELFKIVEPNGNFLQRSFQSAQKSTREKLEKSRNSFGNTNNNFGRDNAKQQTSRWSRLVTTLEKKTLLPVVVFVFSKNQCEELAYNLGGVDLTTAKEKHDTHIFVEAALDRLKGTDKKLPQVQRIKDILKRGIGVHHGGLLPIIKELVEILFSKGRIKVLFATETFAMGVNMPAKAVVFNRTRKFDGRTERDLLPGEYTQMAGRAGRRGKDLVGTVIINIPGEVPESSGIHKMILGVPEKLESQFRLTYNMILNLLRVEDFKVEDMIKRSFSEVHTQKLGPEQKKRLMKNLEELKKSEHVGCIYGEPDIENYYRYAAEKKRMDRELQGKMSVMKNCSKFLVAGRVLWISSTKHPQNIAIFLASGPGDLPFGAVRANTRSAFLASFNDDNDYGLYPTEPERPEDKKCRVFVLNNGPSGEGEVVTIDYSDISGITKQKLNVESADLLRPRPHEDNVSDATQKLKRLSEDSLNAKATGGGLLSAPSLGGGKDDPLEALHPIKDLKINDWDFVEMFKKSEELGNRMKGSKCHKCPKLQEQYDLVTRQEQLKREIRDLRYALSDESLRLMPEFQTRLKILQALNYVDTNNVVQLKGRVARELNTVKDELIATELIFENNLTDLAPEEIVALLSCLIFEIRADAVPQVPDRLEEAMGRIKKIAKNMLDIQSAYHLDVSEQEGGKILNFGLVEVVYQWAKGVPFAKICTLTDVLEGSIVRTITRLDETCKEVRNAARIIGDSTLFTKMEEASRMIKRDIVFATSLYYDGAAK
eukprot:TRINITY_DN4905_c1_g1_i1.p1 TRINITY_DN4905_c1_g1~~TRINITY_DN4905_c1_g1_i1.p1  ORF type:complete len:1322 (-),score=354.13 TRINITY_DN4905_c1_g1_i1:6-3947(-)